MKTNKAKLSIALSDAIKEHPNYDLKFDLDVVMPETAASSIHELAGVGINAETETIMVFIL